MALTERLAILINADGAKAISEFKRVGDAAAKSLGSAETSAAKFAKTLAGVGGGSLSLGGLLTTISASDVQALNQLKASIAATGNSFSDYESQIDAVGKKNLKFAFATEDTNEALRKLVEATNDPKKALSEMQVVADLAASRHIKLAEAADMVARILNGKGGKALAAYGITVKDNADGTKNYQAAVDELGRKLQGQASASVDGFAGKLKVIKTEVEDQIQVIGAKYGPALTGAGAAMTLLSGAIAGAQALSARFAASTAANAAALEAEAVAAGEAAVATEALAAAEGSASGGGLAGFAAGAGSIVAVGAALVGTAAVIDHFVNGTYNADKAMQKMAETADEDLVPAFRKILEKSGVVNVEGLEDRFRKLAEANIGTARRLRDEIAATGQDTSVLDRILEDVSSSMTNAASTTTTFAGSLKALSATIDSIGSQFDAKFAALDAQQAFSAVFEATKKASGAARDYAADQHNLERAAKSVADAEQEVIDAEQALATARQGPSARDLEDANLSRAEAANELSQAVLRVADAQKRLKEARKNGGTEEATQAAVDLEAAQLALRRAQQRNTDAQKDYNDTLNSGAEGSDKVTEAQKRLKDAQDRLEEAQFQQIQTQKAMTEQAGATNDTLREQAGLAETAAGKFKDLIQKLKDSGANTDELVRATKDAITQVDILDQKYGALNPKLHVYSQELQTILASQLLSKLAQTGDLSRSDMDEILKSGVIVPDRGPDGARAAGGPVRAGGSYLVGERGPELVTMGGNGWVTPNSQLGGGSSTFILEVDGAVLGQVVVDQSQRTGGLPIRIRLGS